MPEEMEPTIIAPGGNLILEVRQDEKGQSFAYRVDSNVLRQNSRYFENLLSDRFSEGQNLSAALEALRIAGHSNVADTAAEALPRVSIVNVGRISKVSSIQNLTADFLRALHNQELPALPPIPNIANLAIVADRFDALPHVSRYVQRKRFMQTIDARSKGRSTVTLAEERVRQKLLIGLLLDYPAWVTRYSSDLIIKDSVQWKPGAEEDETAASWWDMPKGVEEEMIQRREYILETINSLQTHFLKIYTSGERQCKLGYDSSVQCDSFQLGEMVRFFTRLSTLRMQGTIYDTSEPTHYVGDIDRLLESLRQVSSYQIDRNHAHCGLRVRLIPLLQLIQNQLNHDAGSVGIGICAECWRDRRELYAWSLAKRNVLWTARLLTGGRPNASAITKKGHQRTPSGCLTRHIAVRDIFMAVERDWTGRDAY